jgi:hypothetical protein
LPTPELGLDAPCCVTAKPGEQLVGEIASIADASQLRAARYRSQAAQFLKLAMAEPVGGLRRRLVDLANEYHDLAAPIEEQHSVRRRA